MNRIFSKSFAFGLFLYIFFNIHSINQKCRCRFRLLLYFSKTSFQRYFFIKGCQYKYQIGEALLRQSHKRQLTLDYFASIQSIASRYSVNAFGFFFSFKQKYKRSLIKNFYRLEMQPQNKEEQANQKVKKGASFQKKASLITMKPTGEEVRPRMVRTNTMDMTEKLYSLMDSYMSNKVPDIQKQIVNHVQYTLARTRFDFKSIHCYQAAAHSVRDRLLQYFNDTNRVLNFSGKKKVYYMSIEFLIGRCFQNALINLDIEDQFKQAFRDFGYSYEKLKEKEVDAGLGNGGLGRLAACFLDSLASLNYPSWGYGIRYQYGIFKQFIKNGYQCEAPDFWLSEGNPWEIERVDVQYKVSFYGNTRVENRDGKQKVIWQNCETIIARAFDTPIPGYATFNTIGLRLWKSMPLNEFDFGSFNSGQYEKALEAKQRAEYITSVLYPNDTTDQGKQLRLKQQYLLVSATIQDIVRRHKSIAELREVPFEWKDFANGAAIQLNDTHPALAIVELFRILIDEEGVDRETAWGIVYNTFSYTNHTIMPEALEKWTVHLMQRLLPRHLQLIYIINFHWLESLKQKIPPQDHWKLGSLSIIQEGDCKKVRMANLSIVGSHTVNGVAALHSQLLKRVLFKDFYDITPDKFTNVTNGVTTRRWIISSNPNLAELYTSTLGTDEWLVNMDLLRPLQKYADNPDFQSKWQAIKQINKKRLAMLIKNLCNVDVDENSLFDVQIKRIHEYKRQFLNILYAIHRYLTLKGMSAEQRNQTVPRTIIFGGKAAPGYHVAKNIIKFINQVSLVVNNDEITKNFLKVVFIPNYNVSAAEIIIPGTQLSQHISTAGTQASGTSNMKFVLNGSMIIGTMDGANIQIHEEVGDENIFIFGAKQEQVGGKKHYMYTTSPNQYIPEPLHRVFQAVREGMFGEKDLLLSVISTISNNNDNYIVTQDFMSYVECQNKVDQTYKDKKKWTKMSILNAVRSGKFSSDRTIREYSQKIWKVESFKVEPCKVIQDIKEISKAQKNDNKGAVQKPQYVEMNFQNVGEVKSMPANRPDTETKIPQQKAKDQTKPAQSNSASKTEAQKVEAKQISTNPQQKTAQQKPKKKSKSKSKGKNKGDEKVQTK